MTSPRSLIIIVISLFTLLTIFGQNPFLIFYQLTSWDTTESTWSETNVDKSDISSVIENYKVSRPWVILSREKDTLYREIANGTPVIITVDSLQIDPLWVPIYKSVDYSARCSIAFKNHSINSPAKPEISGSIISKGHMSITGLCSAKQAKTLIMNALVQSVLAEKKKLR